MTTPGNGGDTIAPTGTPQDASTRLSGDNHPATIRCGSFVRRQTRRSRFSDTMLTWDQVEKLVSENWGRRTPGYRDGVVLVPIPPDTFRTPIVPIGPGDRMKTTIESRAPGEDTFPVTRVSGRRKRPAVSVRAVCYRHDVLGDNATTTADWEIVSINASPDADEVPMHPLTMARNHLGLAGGTEGSWSEDDYARSIVYWATHSMADPSTGRRRSITIMILSIMAVAAFIGIVSIAPISGTPATPTDSAGPAPVTPLSSQQG